MAWVKWSRRPQHSFQFSIPAVPPAGPPGATPAGHIVLLLLHRPRRREDCRRLRTWYGCTSVYITLTNSILQPCFLGQTSWNQCNVDFCSIAVVNMSTRLQGLVGLPDLEALADASDYVQPAVQRHLYHISTHVPGMLEHTTPPHGTHRKKILRGLVSSL